MKICISIFGAEVCEELYLPLSVSIEPQEIIIKEINIGGGITN
jgi:hypothetical protein